MGRIRTLKPEFFRSRSLSRVSRDARLTFAGLWCEADDAGRGEAEARLLKGSIWPLDDDITPAVIQEHLAELAETEHIQIYSVDGGDYYQIVRWERHQSAAYRRGDAKHPAPGETPPPQPPHDESCKKVQAAPDDVLEGKGREGKGTSPTSEVTQAGAGDSRSDQTARMYGDLVLAEALRTGARIGNPEKYAAAAAERVRKHPDFARWLDSYPTAPPSAVAGWLSGAKHSMAYFERVDELASVHPLRPAQ